MSSAIEVLKNWKSKMAKKVNIAFTQEEYNALGEALLALEKQKNGLKCIGCGSIPKLKLCCNSCYQRLKLKEKRQVELIEWLEKEIQYFEMRIGDKDFPNALGFKNKLREVKEMVGEQK